MKSNKYALSLFILFFTISCAFAKEKEKILCKQKESPVSAEFIKITNEPNIRIKFLKNLKSFNVMNVRGLDGLNVSQFDNLAIESADLGREEYISLRIQGESGLQYIVVDFQYQEENQTLNSSVTVAVGEISRDQLEDRSKNIKIMSSGGSDLGQREQQGKNSGTIRIHRMKIE